MKKKSLTLLFVALLSFATLGYSSSASTQKISTQGIIGHSSNPTSLKILRQGWQYYPWSAQKFTSIIDVYQCHYDYLSQAQAIKAIRPDVLTFLYRNTETVWTSASTWEYNPQEEALFKANDWLLKDSSGTYVMDEFGSGYLVDFGNPDYHTWLANWYKQYMDSYNIDGAFLDNWFCEAGSVFWSVSSGQTPINPRTGGTWTNQLVCDAFKALIQELRQVIGNKLIFVNGVYNGDHFYNKNWQSYFINALTTSRMDGVMSEGLFSSYDTSVPYSESTWLNSINFAVWMENNFSGTYLLQQSTDNSYWNADQLPSDMTVVQYQQYVTFCFASRLLTVKRLTTHLSCGYYIDQSYPQSLFKIDIGDPSGDFSLVNGTHVYIRQFSHGLVLVNPTSTSYSVSVPAGLQSAIDGTQVTSPLTIAPHVGMILSTGGFA
jgi:hypothetical protein